LVFRPLMSPSLDIFCRFATLKKRDIWSPKDCWYLQNFGQEISDFSRITEL
jgi:hypothetical protein